MRQTHAFVALYVGETVSEAKIIGASADPELIRLASQVMLGYTDRLSGENAVVQALNQGRKNALRLIYGEDDDEVPDE